MSTTPPFPDENGFTEAPKIDLPARTSTSRWQVVMLIAGALLLLGSVIFVLFQGRDPRFGSPEIEFQETLIYSEALVGEPQYINPLLALSQVDLDLSSLIFSGLTSVDEYGQPVPDLAESWTVSSDGLTYTFSLRQDVTWHDGEPFTATDVAFTMALLRDPDFPGPPHLGAFWRTVETYADDDYTVRFVLTQPLTSFPEYAGIGILPEHWLAGVDGASLPDDLFNLTPVGTGRLRLLSIEDQGNIPVAHLEPYTGYYDPARSIALTGIDFYFYSDSSRAFRALGQTVQGIGNLTSAQLDAALESRQINLYSGRLPLYGAVIFNQQASDTLPFFQDPAVREALALALPRSTIVHDVLGRQAALTDSPILPGTWAYQTGLVGPNYNPEAAAAMLDQAGWTLNGNQREFEGTPLAFTLLISADPLHRDLGQQIAAAWNALGVDVQLETVSPEELVDHLETASSAGGRDFDAALVEISQGGLADPDPYPFWHQSQIETGQNYSGYVNRSVSRALETARRDPNGVRRAEMLREFQQIFIDDTAAIMLYNSVYHYAVSCQIQGVQLIVLADPSDRFRNMHAWRIATPQELEQLCNG